MALNKAVLADLPGAQPTNPALRLPPTRGMGLSFVSQADDKDWDMPRRKRAMPFAQRKLNYDNARRKWKKGGLFGLGRGPKPPAPPAPPPEFAPYVKGVLTWGLAKFFDESKIKRDEDGKFAPKGEGRSKMSAGAPRPKLVGSIYSRGPNEDLRDRPEYDWSRSVRPTKDMPFKVRQAYAVYRDKLDSDPPAAPERGAKVELPADLAPQLPTSGGGRFKMADMRPQVPSTMTMDEYAELGQWAGTRTRDVRDEHIKRSIGRKDPGGHRGGMLLPVGTDPKDRDVKLAYNMARNLAMHDVGLIKYDYRMTPETIQALQPHRTFIKHTRRYLGNILRSERPGVWAQFRREFGTEFADGRTYKFDTAGQKAGEKKKSFERHLNFLKSWQAGNLLKAFGKPGLSEAEIEQRRNAAKARWARVARRADARDDAQMSAVFDERKARYERSLTPPRPGWKLSDRVQQFEPADLAAAKAEIATLTGERSKLFQQSRSSGRKKAQQSPADLVDVETRLSSAFGRRDELRRAESRFNMQSSQGFLWQPPAGGEAPLPNWSARAKRNKRRETDLDLYSREGEYKAAEQAHRQRVKDVRSGKTRSFKPSMLDSPAAPATPRVAPPKSPRMSFGGKAALVGATVLGAGALGYGIARWNQGRGSRERAPI